MIARHLLIYRHLRWGAFLLLIFLSGSCAQLRHPAGRNMTAVFYNVENLFDVENTPGTRDGEFTPEGRNRWDEARYTKKVNDLARVISNINPHDLPEMIGLCEVENLDVLQKLVNSNQLAGAEYRIVHYESPDLRGIDCAFIYRPGEFKVIHHEPVRVTFTNAPNQRTRDILYIKGEAGKGKEFHVFINHWPSRIGGVQHTEHKRLAAATILKSKIDSVQSINPEAQFIIMGDMNDQPDNKSLFEVLRAMPPETAGPGFVNLMFPEFRHGNGSYYYRGSFDMLDNIVVSTSLLESKGWKVADTGGFVFSIELNSLPNTSGDQVPARTYGGSRYYGGASDHFPVFIRLHR